MYSASRNKCNRARFIGLVGQVFPQIFGRWRLANVASLSGIKVMIIDDSNTIRRSAEIFLVQAGCQVILAEDGFSMPWPRLRIISPTSFFATS